MQISLVRVWIQSPSASARERILAIDPGETTGVFFLERTTVGDPALEASTSFLSDGFQIDTGILKEGHGIIDKLIDRYQPQVVVCEDYKVYGYKAASHSWSALHTPKLIGIITGVCSSRNIPLVMQMAGQAKGFCTDDKLRYWNMYKASHKHSNDAARHALLYLITGRKHEEVANGSD